MKEYKKYIFQQPEMGIDEITGEDVEAMVQRLKRNCGRLGSVEPGGP